MGTWSINSDGTFCDHLNRVFKLDMIPSAHLNAYLWDAGDQHLTLKIRERKGLTLWPEIDALQTRQIDFPDNILANLRCIGTLWGDQREKWMDVTNQDDVFAALSAQDLTQESIFRLNVLVFLT